MEATQLQADPTSSCDEPAPRVTQRAERLEKINQQLRSEIDERLRAEERLRKSEEKYRTLFEESRDAIYITAREGTFLDANRAMLGLFGYTKEEMIGLSAREIYANPADREIFQGEAEEKGSVRDYEVQFRRKSGVVMDCLLTATVRRAGDGTILGYQGIVRDITGRKRAAEALRDSQVELLKRHEDLNNLFKQVEEAKREWEDTMDCIGSMVILTDEEGSIKRCSSEVTRFTGRLYGEIVGENWQALLSNSGFERKEHTGEGVELFHPASGRWFILHVDPFKKRDKDGVVGKVITIHDTTTLREMAQALELKNREVETKNSELEAAYAELKATQAKILQQEKMACIGQLAAGVAHEINNPIGFVASNLSSFDKYIKRLTEFIGLQTKIIETSAPTEAMEQQRQYRQSLKVDYSLEDVAQLLVESVDGVDRVRKIVQDLKSFSRVDEADYKLADVNACIESTINIVWNELKYKATLSKEYGSLPLTKCFPQQLNQVFMNLLVNATQAIEKQGEITVKTWHENGSIVTTVSDTGCGIAAQNLNRIFEPFFTTKEVGQGTGLGLSITYDIVKKHGGEISVQSEPGKGTTFTVTIPVRKD
jgi:two-component system, NtrC family, sensor kinase